MQIQVSGKHVDVGDALGSRISQELEDGIGKYFERGAQDAEVVVSKDGHGFKVDCWVRLASGQSLVTTGLGGVAHGAFSDSLEKLEKRVRRLSAWSSPKPSMKSARSRSAGPCWSST